MARVLAIGDVHLPAEHPRYLEWVIEVHDAWQCDRVVFIGDVLDWHSISFHQKELDAPNVEKEYEQAFDRLQEWQYAFPVAEVMIGNHDERVERLAASSGIPSRFIHSFADTWKTPQWEWKRETFIDGVRYLHGTGLGGQQPALRAAKASMVSTVCGHVHSQAGVRWSAGPDRIIFGLDTGCGVDFKHHAAHRYGRDMISKPILGCGVVIDAHPYHECMPF